MNRLVARRFRRRLTTSALVIVGLLASSVIVAAPASAATLTVCASGCSYTTITSAVAAAAPNDQIDVGAGVYNETGILVNKPLTITGQGAGVTIIDGGGGNTAPRAGVIRVQTAAPAAGTGTVTLSGLTVRNPSRTSATAAYFGISLANPGATTGVTGIRIEGVDVQGRNDNLTNSYGIYGTGGVTSGTDRMIPSLTIVDSTVAGHSQNGILLEDWKAAVTVTGSTLNEGTSVASRSAFLVHSTASAGRFTQPFTLTGNTFTGSAIWFSGFYSGATPAPRGGFDQITITDNTMSDLSGNDVAVSIGGTSGPSPAPGGSPAITKVGVVTATGNTITGDGDPAVNTWGFRATGAIDSFTATENSITGVRRGALFSPDASGSATTAILTRNRIFAAVTGLENTSSASIDAAANWWGCQAGPKSGSPYCSPAVNTGAGSIAASTWIVTTASLGSTLTTPGATTPVHTDLTHLNDGSSVTLPAVFDGLSVERTTTGTSVAPATGTLSSGVASPADYTAPLVDGCSTVTVSVDREDFTSGSFTGEPVTLSACVATPPTITSAAPSTGVFEQPYTHTVTAAGTAPLSYAITAGALPPGLMLDSATGVITGTPTLPGTYTYTVSVQNVIGSAAAEYTQLIGQLPDIDDTPPLTVTAGDDFTFVVTSVGTGPITYAITSGTLPPGLALDPATGAITGTAEQAGRFEFVVTASNEYGQDSATFVIVVDAAPTIPPVVVPPNGSSTTNLPATGADPTGLITLGVIALLGGLLISTLVARRRATHDHDLAHLATGRK